MSVINYPATSPYASTPQTSWHIGFYKDRPIPPAKDDRFLVLDKKYEYRPDLLSYDLYNSPAYWWVFTQRNINIVRDPIWDFVSGLEIVIPSLTTVRTYVG